MIRLPPRSTRTDTLFPYTTLFRSADLRLAQVLDARQGELLTDPRGVGVDDLPQQQLGPHSHNLTSHAASMPQGGRVVALAACRSDRWSAIDPAQPLGGRGDRKSVV